MKIELLLLEKTKASYIQQGIDDYAKRLQHYVPVSLHFLKIKKKKQWNEQQQKLEEGSLLLASVPAGAMKVVLDSRGKQISSEDLAKQITNWENYGQRQISFLIGGPLGLSAEVVAKADMLLSLSKMTFTHDMVRLFLLEQLYRAYTIKAGEKYHK